MKALIQELAMTTGIKEADVERTMIQVADMIKDRFTRHNIPMTEANIAKAIPQAFMALIKMGEELMNNPEKKAVFMRQVWDQLEAEYHGGQRD